jgi:putative SOS response-associated peptidase YedK
MCGRYTSTAGQRTLERRFGVDLAGLRGWERYNVAPTEEVLAVVGEPGGDAGAGRAPPVRAPRLLRWGLIPGGARSARVGARMINARSETAATRAPFSKLIACARGRCLIVADGFYEWLRGEDGRQPRQPFRYTVDGGAPFAFAGLWTTARIDGVTVASATILTCDANPVAAPVHDRMPVILPSPATETAWLAEDVDASDAIALCAPLDAARMTVAPVSRRVNRAGVDDPELLDAEAAPVQGALF